MAKIRITSIDIFRGLTMILMIIVNNPGDWSDVYAPLLHSEWAGCTPTDLVFPFFVFAMGMAIPFGSKENSGISKDQFVKITTRSLRLINLGLAINFFANVQFFGWQTYELALIRLIFAAGVAYLMMAKFSTKVKLYSALALFAFFMIISLSGFADFGTARIPGVLQRLGIVYFVAALIYLAVGFRTQVIVGALILIGYWAFLRFIPVPGIDSGGFGKDSNWVGYIDNLLIPNHLWAQRDSWADPEGLLSNLPAIVSGLFGIWCGRWIKQGINSWKLILAGVILVITALIWQPYFPIVKKIWTSSYVIYTSGIAFILMGIFIVLFDGKKPNVLTNAILLWGLNPIILYYGSEIIPQALVMLPAGHTTWWGFLYYDVFQHWFMDLKIGSLLFAITNVVFWTIVLSYMKLKNWTVKV